MTTVTEDGGRLNAYAKEPRMYIDPIIEEKLMKDAYETHKREAPKNSTVVLPCLASSLLSVRMLCSHLVMK